jgi:valyl-tRNA synthetase
MDRYDARRAVFEELGKLGLIVREERPYLHSVGHCYRCHSEIEPWISGLQWFVAVDGLKAAAKQATVDGRTRFWPERWEKAFVTWLDNLRDWNISRQLWWGHRIPAWYCPEGHVTVALEDPTACSTCASAELRQDEDVLDTWFSSQLWPFSTLGWPEETEELRVFYPNAVLVTGYEILYLWVARMMMAGLSFMGDVPFRDAVIHGLVRDGQGRKMSKSLGNVIDPIEVIDEYGADALRFSLARTATGGQQDIPLSVEAIAGGRHFANKIWNAARLVLRAFPGGGPALPAPDRWTVAERWLLSRHQACLAEVDRALDAYLFADAAQALYRFLWSEYCDWGLELEKGRLDGTDAERAEASSLLAWILERTLRALHPTMPFVTEEIWQRFGIGESISIASWPEQRPEHADAPAEATFGLVQAVVTAVRQFRSDHGIAPNVKLAVVAGVGDDRRSAIAALDDQMRRLATLSSLELTSVEEPKRAGHTMLTIPDGWVSIPLAGVVDVEAERARVDKRLGEVESQLERTERKLANEGFTSKAAPSIVDGERDKAGRLAEERARLREQLEELA